MRLLFVFLCCLLLPAATLIAESPVRWVKVSTEHFTVLSDSSEADALATAGQVERLHALFARLLPGVGYDTGDHVIVFALSNRRGDRGLDALLPPAYLSRNALELAGYYMPGKDRSYILVQMDSQAGHSFTTLDHEYTHYMLRHLQSLPLWLNEGEAEFFQSAEITDHTVTLGQPSRNTLLYLRGQTLLPLAALFQVGRDSAFYREVGKGSVFYAEAWALTHMLFLQDFGRKQSRLEMYYDLLRTGHTPVEAAEQAFGDLSVLQQQLENYIGQDHFETVRMPFEMPLTVPLQSVSIPFPEADALRADVLVRTGREAEAEALARGVLAIAPRSPEAYEAMGLLQLRHDDLDGAKKWYGEAAKLHSSNFLAYYYYGALSLQEGDAALPSAEASLREALRLNPHFAPTLESLAECDAMRHDHLDEAVELSLQAVAAEPNDLRYRIGASEIQIARKDWTAALSTLQAALPLAHTDAERSRVQDRLEELQQLQLSRTH